MQMAGHAALHRFDFFARARRVAQDAAGVAPQRASGVRQFQLAAAHKQRRANLVFHIA
ncbi:hypothetical protein D3C71_2084950 [compost metagenome]